MKKSLTILVLLLFAVATQAQKDKAELKQLRQRLDSCQAAARQQQALDSALIDSLRRELNALAMFRQAYVKDRLLSGCPALDGPCSATDTVALAAFIDKLLPFSGDAEVDSVRLAAERHLGLTRSYHSLTAPLHSPYDRQAVKQSYDALLALRQQPGISDAQSADFRHAALLLSKYVHCVKIAKTVMSSIDAELEPYATSTNPDTQAFCVNIVNKIVATTEAADPADNPRYKYIAEIPFLASRFDTYLSAMRATPLTPGDDALRAKTEINQIVTD